MRVLFVVAFRVWRFKVYDFVCAEVNIKRPVEGFYRTNFSGRGIKALGIEGKVKEFQGVGCRIDCMGTGAGEWRIPLMNNSNSLHVCQHRCCRSMWQH